MPTQNSSSKHDISTIIKYIVLKTKSIFICFTCTDVADKILFLKDTCSIMYWLINNWSAGWCFPIVEKKEEALLYFK